jgi:hypothetical protein
MKTKNRQKTNKKIRRKKKNKCSRFFDKRAANDDEIDEIDEIDDTPREREREGEKDSRERERVKKP